MKRLLIIVGLLLSTVMVQAQDLSELIKIALLDHVSVNTLYGFREQDQGPTKIALVDSIIKIGQYEGSSILDIQAGFLGNTNEVEGENQIGSWLAGVQIRIDPYIREKVPLPGYLDFLKTIVHGPVAYYNITENKWFTGYSVGLGFNLNTVTE